MRLTFARLAFSLVAFVATSLVALPAVASDYPTHAVKLVVPYPPGGSADILARMLEQKLGTALGQAIIVENKPGAGTAIGADYVAHSEPDGYTLLLGTVSSQAMNPAVKHVAYDPVKDFIAIAPVATIPFVLDLNPSVPAKTVKQFVAWVREHPGKVNYSSAGTGTSNHLAGVLFNQTAGIDLVHIPYKGSAPALQDLVAGRVQAMFDLVTTSLPMIKADKVRPIAVTSAERVPTLPHIPTLKESGYPDYDVTAWFGLFAPAGTAPAVIARLHDVTAQALADPAFKDKLATMGMTPMEASQADFARTVAAEAVKWRSVVKSAHIKAD